VSLGRPGSLGHAPALAPIQPALRPGPRGPVDSWYIDAFISSQQDASRGGVLEVREPHYASRNRTAHAFTVVGVTSTIAAI
jgi:hypothetical protein